MGLIKKQVKEEVKRLPDNIVDTSELKISAMKAIAYGRELSDYEVLKDKRISAAGVVQAVGGQVYAAIAMGLPAEKADAFVEEKSRLMLDLINRIAEGK